MDIVTRVEKTLKRGTERAALWRNETEFLRSLIKQQQERAKPLTPNQNSWLQKIEAKVEAAWDDTWEASWTSEKETHLRIALDYYATEGAPYYSNIVRWVEENPDKLISKNNFQAITENKYVKKIIKALTDDPLYPAGSHVTVRANAGRDALPVGTPNYCGELLFVLSPLDKATTPAKGARIYRVLPADSVEPFEVEERWLKKYRPPSPKKK
jgi:hypothetical protein